MFDESDSHKSMVRFLSPYIEDTVALRDHSHASAQCALASATRVQFFAIEHRLNLKDRVLDLKNSSNLTGIFCLILAIARMRFAILLEFTWLPEF
jgi:hypothetical protein